VTPGTYAYRFSGSSVDENGDPYHLVGVGVLVLAADKTITGEQTSSITRLDGQGAALEKAHFTIKGSYTGGEVGQMGQATLQFSSDASPRQYLTGDFAFVAAAPDRMWLISTGAMLTNPDGRPINGARLPDEVVSGEAVRVG